MRFPRSVRAELLDQLDAVDPRAVQSRRDLQKLNALMGTPRAIARAMHPITAGVRIVELGAGDGMLLLSAARRLDRMAGRVQATLVDQRPSVGRDTRAAFDRLGWDVEVISCDVFDWFDRGDPWTADITVANLFLHHFEHQPLVRLLVSASRQTRRFVACEPLRSRTALVGASLVRFVGCNDVTRHDAVISVCAGFRDRELSAAWPTGSDWHLTERRSGPFLHTFVADHVA